MRQDSETNIIVLNTALKYKIQRNTHTQKTKNILNKTHTKNISILNTTHTKKSQCRSQRDQSHLENV